MAVDAFSGETYLNFDKNARSENVTLVMFILCKKVKSEGYSKLTVILDNNPTHKKKMRLALDRMLSDDPTMGNFEVEFVDTPPYSPDYNLVEYCIHQLRLRFLHNGRKLPLSEIIEMILINLEKTQLMTEKQIKNTVNHILKLGKVNTC